MRRALVLALALCACSLRAPRTTGQPCASTSQCNSGNVCFLGECRGGTSSLSIVSAEVTPSTNSPFLLLQEASIDLHLSVVHDFELQAPFVVAGAVHQEQEDGSLTLVAGAVLTFTDHTPAIPDRVDKVTAKSDSSGQFSARLPAATWDVLLQPPAPLPPSRGFSQLNANAPSLDLRLPKPSSLVQVNGVVNVAGAPLSGAQVIAVDSAGLPLSAPATSADGGFALQLPPGTTSYLLQVGPPTDADGGVTSADPLPSYDSLVPSPTLAPVVNLALSPAAALQGRVLDALGNPVTSARVYARSSGSASWSLSRSTAVGPDGSYSLSLRQGSYVVEAAPAALPDQPGVSPEGTVSPPVVASYDLICPAKAHAFGQVRKPDGTTAGAGYQITATRLADDLIASRSASSTPTNASGVYHLVGDEGRYKVEVQPPTETGLPLKIVQMELSLAPSEYALPDIQISAPVQVVGTVHGTPPGGSDGPVAGAQVDIYALDATGQHAVKIGGGSTDAQGRYKVVLPDVPQPGTAP